MKIWILFLCAIAAGVSAQSDEADALDWDDGWNEDYNDEWFRTQLEKLGIYNDEQKDAEDSAANVGNLEKDQDDMDKVVEEDIKKFQENEDDDDKIDDYQFEDNRSEQSEESLGNSEDTQPILGSNQDFIVKGRGNDYDDYALKVDDDDFEPNNLPEEEDDDQESKFSKDDDIVPLQPPQSSDEIKHIMEEAQAIINEEENKPNHFTSDETIQENDEFNKIMEETKVILDGESLKPNDFNTDNDDDDVQENDNISKIMEETKDILDEENRQLNDFADGEINQDDDKLFHLLRDNVDDSEEADDINQINIPEKTSEDFDDDLEKEINDNLSENIVDEDDDTVDKVYEDLNEDLDQLFETLDKLNRSENEEDQQVKPADVDYAVNSDESLDDKSDYENIFDSNLSDIFAEHSKVLDDKNVSEVQGEEEAEDSEIDDDQSKETSEKQAKQSVEQSVQQLPYINDALPSEGDDEEKPIKSVNVDELSDNQLVQLMKDFEVQHSDAFDAVPTSDDHIVNEIDLEYGETKVIKSDNYPSGYPTNRIVDWIVTGKGQGIELNVTDFAVNSALGDYLMVKPGQIDDSGPDGIIFSYHLNQPRAYRFTDVNRIFLRFDSKLGMSFLRGFNLTLKIIAPLPEDPEPEPEPEPLLPEPRHSLTVMLGGLTLAEFQEIHEDFRLLVADMATMYINANDIDPGMNTTAEITQITSASICNVHWPGYEECAQIRFSVPLVYEDQDENEYKLHEGDLQTMWDTYVAMDPFAARLRQMGIEEFSVPNDGGVLTVWLVVALGVMVSAAMMAIALWRYSCFEDYTRMPADGDTDSLHEKRSSLYPTPHQMLPPLYADNDYLSTKVDMGGYENRSYTRTDMYDLDSDEDAIVTRDRNAGIQPRDIFSV